MNPPQPAIRALIFDVFGTLVDWHGSIAREVTRVLGPRVPDPTRFAEEWRAQYQPAMQRVRSGEIPFCKLDLLHRINLDQVLAARGLHDLDEPTRAELNTAWHRLDAWPDVRAALQRLQRRYFVAPCSNGNISLMVDLARRNGLGWDAILGAELARDYKPQPVVYLTAAAAFDCSPAQTLMVATHSDDLAAAAACGLRTAHVARPDERGPGLGEHGPRVPVDWQARDLLHLADQLGA